MASDYTYSDDTGELRINCLGYLYGPSIEEFPECMARVIDTILDVKKVSTLTLVGSREYEYSAPQVRLLTEIAEVIEGVIRERLVTGRALGTDDCAVAYPEWRGRVQQIAVELLRTDPVGAYVELLREIRYVKLKMKRTASRRQYNCYYHYLKNILLVLKGRLGKTELVKRAEPYLSGYHVSDRSVYRELFVPSTRPNFMLTRYMMTPPEGAAYVDRYRVGSTEVEIFRVPQSTQYYYYAIPPEFRLSQEKYTLLDEARRSMAAHRPTTAEFVRSEKIREIFFNIGKDTIREIADRMGMSLSTKELEDIATILTRYTAGLGILEVLLADEKIQDIYLNSPVERDPVLIFHQDYQECRTNIIPSRDDAEAWATRLRIQSGRPLDEANPVLDTNLDVPGGSARFAVITKTLSPYGIGFAIRRHRDKPWTLPLFIRSNMLTPLSAGLLSFLIDGSASLLVAGGRSSGKTSVLGALMLEMLPKTRSIVIEDTLELPVSQMRELGFNIERLKSRSVITRVETEMPAEEALRTALRLGDSALIVGEIRSKEASALYEAMRIGALSNIVAGTIHGESPYGVYDRVVNDLDVPATSFKATDIIIINKMLRSADGLHRFRRMTDITEVRKEWETNPLKEGGFIDLMAYSGKEDQLKPTDTLVNGESEIINRIASYVKDWAGNWEVVWENIKLRAKIKQAMVEMAEQAKKPDLLEAPWTIKSNERFHLLQEKVRQESGTADAREVYKQWAAWFTHAVKGKEK